MVILSSSADYTSDETAVTGQEWHKTSDGWVFVFNYRGTSGRQKRQNPDGVIVRVLPRIRETLQEIPESTQPHNVGK